MAVVALIIAATALLFSIGTFVLLLTLPNRFRNAYPGLVKRVADLENHTLTELARLAGSQSHLYRYVEQVDATVGSNGPGLHRARMRAAQAQFGKLGDN